MMNLLALTVLLLFVSNCAWLLFAIRLQTQHRRERSELYSRLMSDSLAEYKAVGTDKPPKAPRGRNYVKRSLERAWKKHGK